MRVVWSPQPGPQHALVDCPLPEIFFGGARGGGKTDGVLGKYAIKAETYGEHFNGVFFRRELPMLDDAIERSSQIYSPLGAVWHEQKKLWRFPSGGRLRFRPLERVQDADKYQGQNISDACVEEAGIYPDPAPIDRLNGILRSAAGIPTQLILTGNPGGPGHNWIKARYVTPNPRGMKALSRQLPNGDAHKYVFIPSRLENNRILTQNDPGYVNRLYLVGNAELVRAWLEGDWNVVAGGMFDDVWAPLRHILDPFPIPKTWRIDRSFDWGSSRPFSVGWWAESDGSSVKLLDGSERNYPRGTLFRIGEWYGWNGKPNEGLKMTDAEIARGIKGREETMRMIVRPGPADSSIFDEVNGDSPAKQQSLVGIKWDKADKSPGSRKRGWSIVRARLKSAMQDRPEEPGLFIFSTCDQFIRTVPTLPRDKRDPDDVDSDAEDHIGDEVRYRCLQLVSTAAAVPFKLR